MYYILFLPNYNCRSKWPMMPGLQPSPSVFFMLKIELKIWERRATKQIWGLHNYPWVLILALQYLVIRVFKDLNSAPTSNFLLLYYFLLQLRLYKNELSIEEVIRGRTQGIFHEKCRDYYTISNTNSWYSEVFKTLDIFSYVIACSTKSSIQIPRL